MVPTLPCWIPLLTVVQSKNLPLTATICFLSVRNEPSHLRRGPLTPTHVMELLKEMEMRHRMKGASKVQIGNIHRHVFQVHFLSVLRSCATQESPKRKQCWHSVSWPVIVMCSSTRVSHTSNSNTCAVTDIRLTEQ